MTQDPGLVDINNAADGSTIDVEPRMSYAQDPVNASEIEQAAAKFGLKPIGTRAAVVDYLKMCWARRHFIIELSAAREQSENSESRLGQLWRLLNPLLNVAVYFLIFGVIFKGRGSVSNYISFLVIGVFFFGFTQQAILGGSRAVTSNMALVRAFSFPRALLPISVVIEELNSLGPAIIICLGTVLISGGGFTWTWFLLVPAIILQTMFNVGIAMALARITERVRDVAKLLPFFLRTWLYLSGVVFPISQIVSTHHNVIGFLLAFNPAAVFIELARDCLLASYSVPPITWAYGVFWAVAMLGVGFYYFWQAETRYGRG